jgi:ferrous iron transport protein B
MRGDSAVRAAALESPAASELAPHALRVALVGNPNTGKSTLFNALTGLRQRVANFPGVTVERVEGEYVAHGQRVSVIDLPGCYSLTPDSPDEAIVHDVLLGRTSAVAPPDVIVIVVDAENLERNLFFVSQVLELDRPTVLALNRIDRLEAAGISIDIPELINELGITVVPVAATRGQGVDHLRRVIAVAQTLPRPAGLLAPSARDSSPNDEAETRYAWASGVIARTVVHTARDARTSSDRVDSIVLHRVWGPLIFLAVMGIVFQAMFTWARPLMNELQALFNAIGALITYVLPAGDLRSLIVNGVIAGVGSVVVFLPQITILFLLIGLLEDTGYMARAAFVMDRFMRPLGLHGKSFIPLVSGYACAVPAIMATRTIKEPKERLATILVVPLMSCSARLPVYTLLIGAFVPAISVFHFANLQGITLLAMYALGTVGAFVMATIFRRTLLRSPARALILELPPYSMPRPRVLMVTAWQRVRIFLRRAGTVIFAVSIVLWALATYPRSNAPTADAQLAHSALGHVGQAIAPVVRPLGYDWKIGVSIISSFAAREVFVSTMATIYRVDDATASAQGTQRTLAARLRVERGAHGAPAYTTLVAVGLMAFYVFALMCTSTVAVTIRECGGGWTGAKWAAVQFTYMLILAYGVAFIVYRVGLALGLGGGT